jgi:hypothetical protein
MRKRAVEQAARAVENNAKHQRGRKGIADTLGETINIMTKEMKATRELLAQKSPQERASAEFIHQFNFMETNDQLIVLRAFELESTARLFLVTANSIELRRSLVDNLLTERKEQL